MLIPHTGKWVMEYRWTGYQYTRYFAITRRMRAQGAYLDNSAYVYYDMYDGTTRSALNGSVVTTLTGGQTSYGDNVTRYWMMALDMDAMQASFYVNSTLISTIAIPELPDDGKGNYVWTWTNSNGGSGSNLDERFNFGQDATFFGAVSLQNKTDASGLGQFYNTVPDGHKCLCTKNLPPRTDVLVEPQKHFDTLVYTGDTSGNLTVTGLEFKPDFVWIKRRTGGTDNHQLFDTVRDFTSGRRLFSNSDGGEAQNGSQYGMISVNDGGFTVGAGPFEANRDGDSHVAWCWKAGGAAVSNTDGDITSSVSVNEEAGFSIATYTGSTASGALTVGHGLGKKPAWVMIKRRDDSGDWIVGHKGLAVNAFANNKFLKLEENSSVFTNSLVWGAEPTTTVTQIVSNGAGGAANLTSSGTYVMYSWAEIPGYSKFGSYVGNGESDGTFVNVGFKPAFVFIKCSSGTFNWMMYDSRREPLNVMDKYLMANSSNAEAGSTTDNPIDFLANGFKLRYTNTSTNQSGGTYIYMAFADRTGLNQYNLAVNGH